MGDFANGARVKVTEDHNQFKACQETIYRVEATNKVAGHYSVMLSQDGKVMGAIPQDKLLKN